MEKQFDKTIGDRFGIVFGNEKLVFIKTGRGGSIYGFNNKYVNLANKLYEQFGYTVVISAIPTDLECVLKTEIDEIKECIFDFEEIIYIGISAGALIGAQQGHLNEKITNMLLINGPLMINWPKTKKGIEQFRGKSVEMIYGTKDPSYRYFEILNCINSIKLKSREIPDIDHNFSGKEEIFEREIIRFVMQGC